MAEIQAALSVKLMQVASAYKSGHKDVMAASAQLASFFGVLNTQLTTLETTDEGLAMEIKHVSSKKPLLALSEADPASPAAAPVVAHAVTPLISDSALQSTVMATVASAGLPAVMATAASASLPAAMATVASAGLPAVMATVASAGLPAAMATVASAGLPAAMATVASASLPAAMATVASASLPAAMATAASAGLPAAMATAASASLPAAMATVASASLPAAMATAASAGLPAAMATVASANLPAAMAIVASANLPDVNDPLASTQNAEPDVVLSKQGGEVGEKSAGVPEPEGLIKVATTAIAADTGQELPLTMPSRQPDASLAPAEAMTEAKLESVVSPALSALAGARADAGAVSSITLVHPFEQALRQAEPKVNAAIEAPVRSAPFATELADKVVWLAGRQGQLADLSLNPPEMGVLEVRLTVSGGDASAQFFSPNPIVRDAIDAALPKLRELMAQAGLSLGEAEVRDHAFSRREGSQMQGQAHSQDVEIVVDQAALAGIGAVRSSGLGLVDLYI